MDGCIECELKTLVNILSIKVAETVVILVFCLLIAGKEDWENKQLTKLEVGTCRSNFNKSMLKVPAM